MPLVVKVDLRLQDHHQQIVVTEVLQDLQHLMVVLELSVCVIEKLQDTQEQLEVQ
jgi:hypothetical protein